MARTIIHLDLDAFFCAVEEQRDPSLAGKAFAVGAPPESRGVVATCSYAARRYGVRSAMAMARAVRLCPGLVIVPPRFSVYRALSRQVMERVHAVTPLVEQVSIDEAFLDVGALGERGDVLARRLQTQIQSELGLPSSLGVASNKLVAKIATDAGKAAARAGGAAGPPNAILVVPPGEEAAFLAPLPAEALWGVGPKTAAQLAALGVHTIGDLARWPEDDLLRRFGKHGHDLARHARGIDERPVVLERATRSVSQETTFARDVRDGPQLRATLAGLARGTGRRLRAVGLSATTVKLKLRWADFTTVTRQLTLPEPTDQDAAIAAAAARLFDGLWAEGRPVRLLGVGVSGLQPARAQLSLWDVVEREKERRLEDVLAKLHARFGEASVRTGGELLEEAEQADEAAEDAESDPGG